MSSNIKENYDKYDIPMWLSSICRDVFIQMIRNRDNNAIVKVMSIKFLPLIQHNKLGTMTFMAIGDYIKDDIRRLKSVEIKILPDSSKLQTEIDIYTRVIPRFEAILREVGDYTALGARCLYHFKNHKEFIILEDLVPQGYSLCDGYINLDCAKILCMKLAKFHAVSYKLAIEDPSFFDQYHHRFTVSPNVMSFCALMTNSIQNFINMLDRIPNLRKYIPYFVALLPNLALQCIASNKEFFENRRDDTIYVLSHGDLSLKNTTFKYSQQSEPLDAMLLDFQANMAPIVHDLIDLLYNLVCPLKRQEIRDEILYIYFIHFKDTLTKIGFTGRFPKLTEFREQFVQQRHYELTRVIASPHWLKTQQNLGELRKVLEMFLHLGYFDY